MRKLTRFPNEGRLGGVCAGLAVYFDVDVALVRLVWVVLSIWPGAIVLGVIAYVAAWVIVPVAEGSGKVTSGRRLLRSRTDRQIAGVCGGIAEYLSVDATVVRLAWAVLTIIPGAIVLGVLAYLLAWFIVPPAPAPTLQPQASTP